MSDWIEELINDLPIPVGQAIIYLAAAITGWVALYRKLPVIKAWAVNVYTFATIVPTVRRMNETLETIREQVENSHTTNLRDELDQRHKETQDRLKIINGRISGVQRDIGRLDEKDMERGKDIRVLSSKIDDHMEWSRDWVREAETTDRKHASRLGDLEDTLNPKKEK